MTDRFIFLVRHGSRDVKPREPEREHRLRGFTNRPDSDSGPYSAPASGPLASRSSPERMYAVSTEPTATQKTESIAGALAEQLDVRGLTIDTVFCSPHAVAIDTATIFHDVLRARHRLRHVDVIPADMLAPEVAPAETDRWLRNLSESAILIIGHQPRLTQIAVRMLGVRLPSQALPLGGSEVACIRLGANPRLLWLLTEKPSELRVDLRDKIKSKLDVSKFFLSALVVNSSVLLSSSIAPLWSPNQSWSVRILASLGSAALLASMAFTVGTLLAFDRLAMPPEFWSEPHSKRRSATFSDPARWSVSRPPSEAVIVLFYEMMNVWKRLFEPALASAIVAILCFFLAIISATALISAGLVFVLALSAGVVAIAAFIYYRKYRPQLGFDD
jgi:phosphohistidine phosphatase SixA